MSEEVKRPKLTDPKEWAIIRKMYFEPENLDDEQREQKDREEAKAKQKNQAR